MTVQDMNLQPGVTDCKHCETANLTLSKDFKK